MPNVIELLNTVEDGIPMLLSCVTTLIVRVVKHVCLYIQVMHDLAFLPPITETTTNFSPSLRLVYTLTLPYYISLYTLPYYITGSLCIIILDYVYPIVLY